MSVTGQGSLNNQQRSAAAAPPGPPFAATSANNGVSVDPVTGKIVLGDDVGSILSQLISNREIDMNGFFVQFLNALLGINTTIPLLPLDVRLNVGVNAVLGSIQGSSINYPAIPANAYFVHPNGSFGIVTARAANDVGGANFTFFKTRSANAGSNVPAVVNDDQANISFIGITGNGTAYTSGRITQKARVVNLASIDTDLRFTNSVGGVVTEIIRLDPNGGVSIGGGDAGLSAKLQVNSTTKGMLVPRMTTAQKNAIAAPATSLLVFDTTLNEYNYFDGVAWVGFGGTATASNGLSVDSVGGVDIVLGQDVGAVGDPAALISNREIPMAGFLFQMNDLTNNPFLYLDPNGVTPQISIGDVNGSLTTGSSLILGQSNGQISLYTSVNGVPYSTALEVLSNVNSYAFGDLSGNNNNSKLEIDDAAMLTQISVNGNYNVGIDEANFLYVFGDGNNLGLGPLLQLDGTLGQVELYGGTTVAKLMVFIDEINQLAQVKAGANLFLSLDTPNSRFRIGDIGGGNLNGGVIDLDDTANTLTLKNTANTLGININGVAGFSGTVLNPVTITVNNGIVTNVA